MRFCRCECGRPLKKDSKGRMPKFHKECFFPGRPLSEGVKRYLSLRAREPRRIAISSANIKKLHAEVKAGIRKPGHYIDGVSRCRDDGYIQILQRGHLRANKKGYVLEHILAMELSLQRQITKEEVVHHINRIRYDNRPENLQVLPSAQAHMRLHSKEDNRRDEKGRFRPFREGEVKREI